MFYKIGHKIPFLKIRILYFHLLLKLGIDCFGGK